MKKKDNLFPIFIKLCKTFEVRTDDSHKHGNLAIRMLFTFLKNSAIHVFHDPLGYTYNRPLIFDVLINSIVLFS